MESTERVKRRLGLSSTAPTSEPQVVGSAGKKLREVRPLPIIDHALVPYPARLKHTKFIREYGHFLYMFRQLKINLPFIEAFQHMPSFLKDLLKQKDRQEMLSTVPLNLGIGELISTRMPFSLADSSFKYPKEIIENLLVKVDNLVFPVDVVFLDMEAYDRVPIILGHPFLCTVRALIDVFEGKITLRADDDSATYIAKSMRHPSGQDSLIDPCNHVDR
ncbi:uncharacterized protein LOC143579479 [Bidens hawaiensis]|uniref:uncharacterized protein LOC143579479 n=1 Tax=Bidens hawaiensis TaxID=980011 RepID=UPI00404AA785